MNSSDWLNEMVNVTAYQLQNYIQNLNLTKNEAVYKVMHEGMTGPKIIKMALDRLDDKLITPQDNKVFYAVYLSHEYWYSDSITKKEFTEAGFIVKENKHGNANCNVYSANQLVAKMFENKSEAMMFMYGSSNVVPIRSI